MSSIKAQEVMLFSDFATSDDYDSFYFTKDTSLTITDVITKEFHDYSDKELDAWDEKKLFLRLQDSNLNSWVKLKVYLDSEESQKVGIYEANSIDNIFVINSNNKITPYLTRSKDDKFVIYLEKQDPLTIYAKSSNLIDGYSLYNFYDIEKVAIIEKKESEIAFTFVGIFLFLAFYSVLMFFITNQREFLYYSGYSLALIAMYLFNYGVIKYDDEISTHYFISISVIGSFYVLFSTHFLSLKKYHPKILRAIQYSLYVVFIFIINIIVLFILSIRLYKNKTVIFYIIGNIFILCLLFLEVFSGYDSQKFIALD